MTSGRKAKILFLCDKRGWAYDTTAQNLKLQLAEQFDFDVAYVAETPELKLENYDLLYVFWWGEKYHRLFTGDQLRVVKEISSHRWQFEERYGQHTPQEALERYMQDAGHFVTTSRRLYHAFSQLHPRVHQYSLGVDVRLYFPRRVREGALVAGWAGNIHDETKGVSDILLPACGADFILRQATGELSMAEMATFYNDIDVICIASTAEGTPLPLLEAMACGCFPIAADVGVAPELIQHGKNGLIVDRTADSFRAALVWCRENIETVRRQGEENASLIRNERSWQNVSQQFAETLTAILKDVDDIAEQTQRLHSKNHTHVQPCNHGDIPVAACCGTRTCEHHDFELLLPSSRDGVILVVGANMGCLLEILDGKGYRRIWGVCEDPAILNLVRSRIGDKVEGLRCAEPQDFLARRCGVFDSIILVDALEQVSNENLRLLIHSAHRALKEQGRILFWPYEGHAGNGRYASGEGGAPLQGDAGRVLAQILSEAGFHPPSFLVSSWLARKLAGLGSWAGKTFQAFCNVMTGLVGPTRGRKDFVVYADKRSRGES